MKKETEYFFKMPFSIVENEDLSITDKFLFGIVLNLTNKTGTCTASNAYIADRLKLSTKTIERSFKSLRDNGFIETINIYENGTKRIVRRDTKIVPSNLSFDTLKLSNSTLKNEDTLPSNLSFDTLKNEGDKKINIKEENKRDMDASLRSASVSLSTKKDINNHKPYQAIKEVGDVLIDDDVTDEDIDIIVRFIEYRDEMYNRTKDKKYGLKSYRAIQLFMIEIYKSNDIYKAFETMELNEWTTYKKEWDKNK